MVPSGFGYTGRLECGFCSHDLRHNFLVTMPGQIKDDTKSIRRGRSSGLPLVVDNGPGDSSLCGPGPQRSPLGSYTLQGQGTALATSEKAQGLPILIHVGSGWSQVSRAQA